MPKRSVPTAPYNYSGWRITPPTQPRPYWRARSSDGKSERRGYSQSEVEGRVDECNKTIVRAEAGLGEQTHRTVAELAASMIAHLPEGAQKDKHASRCTRIVDRLGHLTLAEWSGAANEVFFTDLRAERLPSTVNGYGQTMNALVRWGQKLKWLSQVNNPMWDVKANGKSLTRFEGGPQIERDTIPDGAMIDLIIKGFIANGEDDLALAVRVVKGCGLRYGEVFALRDVDIDFDRGLLVISRSIVERRPKGKQPPPRIGSTKNGRSREVPFPASLADDLRAQAARTTNGDDPETAGLLFPRPTRTGPQLMQYKYWYYRWKKAADVAGWPMTKERNPKWRGSVGTPQWGLHDVRHYFATYMLFDVVGMDRLATVSRWLGHKKESFTFARYVGERRGDRERDAALGKAVMADL